jgi:hypothetical protein
MAASLDRRALHLRIAADGWRTRVEEDKTVERWARASGPDADRRAKLLIYLPWGDALLDAYSQ